MLNSTWIDPEEVCYPSGAEIRRGRVILKANPHNPIRLAYGELRAVRCGIPDTYFTIPAKIRTRPQGTVRGYVSVDTDTETFTFTPEANPDACEVCKPGEGCKKG